MLAYFLFVYTIKALRLVMIMVNSVQFAMDSWKNRMIVVGYVQRGNIKRVFSMRKANEREQKKYKKQLGAS